MKGGRSHFYKHIVLPGLEKVSDIENSLSLHQPNTKRVFGVDLNQCNTHIHILDLWVSQTQPDLQYKLVQTMNTNRYTLYSFITSSP